MNIRKKVMGLSMGLAYIVALSLVPVSSVQALHIQEITCTNSCVIVYDASTGITSIQDCCGGTVTTTMKPHPRPVFIEQ